jgi:hypothetical protein
MRAVCESLESQRGYLLLREIRLVCCVAVALMSLLNLSKALDLSISQQMFQDTIEMNGRDERVKTGERSTSQKKAIMSVEQMEKVSGDPMVCIVVTTFNVIDYIPQALDSVLAQTYRNIHIVIVDDGSTDGTPEHVKQRYQTLNIAKLANNSYDPVIDLVTLPYNTLGGTGQPSNIGMYNCNSNSRYLMFQDGDDYMEPDAVQVMVARAELYGADMVMADFDLIASDNTTISSYDKSYWDHLPLTEVFDVALHSQALHLSPVPWRKLYRIEILEEYNIRFLE